MERLHYRSTSLLDLQAELRQQELLREARAAGAAAARHRAPRALPFGLSVLRRRFGV
ncbi:MAG: hypothetical protein M3Y29_07980 [Chloroflexota bacterium]|jgi:hypothetical protein|nr:hypothetical protein [Chloroflexota bacterium]